MSKKIPKKLKIYSLKIHKGAHKTPKNFLNKGTKHKKNYYMEGLNSKNKNKNIKGADPLKCQNMYVKI